MEKEFVKYEQALALKKLGFNEPCFGYYVSVEVPNPFLVITKISDTQGGYFTFAPLYQQAFRWFREEYKLYYTIEGSIKEGFQYFVYTYEYEIKSEQLFNTHEEAELECLKKLIEIVKNEG
jgi:hypothetical protein